MDDLKMEAKSAAMTPADEHDATRPAAARSGRLRVLIVDDSRDELRELSAQLHHLVGRWEIRYATSARQALELMERSEFDAVVSDQRMPLMDGVQLLDTARDRYPHLSRLLITSPTDNDGGMRFLQVSHQTLSKPYDAPTLQRAVERNCDLQRQMERPEMREALRMVSTLPALPKLYWSLVREIDSPRSSSQSIAAIIEQDVAMTGRVLQMANSVAYSSGRVINSVHQAVTRLGVMPIRSVLIALHLVRAMSDVAAPPGFSLAALQKRSMQTAQLASQMLRRGEQRTIAFSAGVLHDIGTVAIAMGMPQKYVEIREAAARDNRSIAHIETELLGCTHADVGAYMLTQWGLPIPLVEAVAYHLEPARYDRNEFSTAAAVHVASVIAARTSGDSGLIGPQDVDAEFLEGLELTETVNGWLAGEPVEAV